MSSPDNNNNNAIAPMSFDHVSPTSSHAEDEDPVQLVVTVAQPDEEEPASESSGESSAMGASIKTSMTEKPSRTSSSRSNAPPRNSEMTAGFLSRAFFFYVGDMFKVTRQRTKQGSVIQQSDIWELNPVDDTVSLYHRFHGNWQTGESKMPPNAPEPKAQGMALKNLRRSLVNVVSGYLVKGAIFKLLVVIVTMANPFVFFNLISSIGDTKDPWKGYMYASLLAGSIALKALFQNHFFHHTVRAALQSRSICTTAVYHKALHLSASSRQTKTTGEIMNVMQLDSVKIEQFLMTVHELWSALLQIAGLVGILYYYIQWSAFVGLAVMLIAVPLNFLIVRKLVGYVKKLVKHTDTRVKITNECLQGVLGVKMAGWERSFVDTIEALRQKEIKVLKSAVIMRALMSVYISSIPAFTAVAALSAFALTGNDVDAAILFTALNTFNLLRLPLMQYPAALAAYADAKVSGQRIADFLSLEEIEDADAALEDSKPPVGVAVEIVDGEFHWTSSDDTPPSDAQSPSAAPSSKQGKVVTRNPSFHINSQPPPIAPAALADVNVQFKTNSLTAIIGPVGSGKSTLCNAILREMFQVNGTTKVSGPIAYVAQSSWIQNATVRDNILFGEPYDQRRYYEVIRVCQLQHDFKVLEAGDQTMIGERGINLSGGQKQRISIARAAYSSKDIVLLDDPLSALDPGVAAKLFNECILKYMKDRTRILVTNQLNFLNQCDWVVVLSGGEEDESASTGPGTIAEQGSYSTLAKKKLAFSKLMNKFNDKARESESEDNRNETSSVARPQSSAANDGKQDADFKTQNEKNTPNDLMQQEEREKGAVQFQQYNNFIVAGGGWLIFSVVFLFFLMTQASHVLNSQWVSQWSASANTNYTDFDWIEFDEEENPDTPLTFYVVGYAITAVVIALSTFLRMTSILTMGIRASVKLHRGLLSSVLSAPMSFFDTTPTGRILSRFSKDLYLLDNQVVQFISFFLFSSISVLSTLVVISVTTPIFAPMIVPIALIYYYLLSIFRPFTREIKRLESISRSPVYSHFGETLGGLSTIRAYEMTSQFKGTNADKVNVNINNYMLVKLGDRWLGVRLEFLGATIALAASLLAVSGSIGPAQAGFSLSFATNVTMLLNFTVRAFAEMEAGMNSVERILHYSKNIEQETPEASATVTPPANWPSQGEIVIKDLKMRYRENTPLVLKGISLTIQGGHRVGVVGRTGSGKSSLMLCLLRLVEPVVNGPSGPILIDGVDITKIGLHALRKKISIVPQNPTIFSGTVRKNLDPFNEYSDTAIWTALEKCNLKDLIAESPDKLNFKVAEFGENFSQGQRQLLCLARSLLDRAKILLLDEATSSVDFETDVLIQKTIRSKSSFADCTILTIAHRINTVIDNDRILVLDAGTVGEYDDPRVLMANPRSLLYGMVHSSTSH